jgi:SP family arabinose:H+ symporter-like MFS transporter
MADSSQSIVLCSPEPATDRHALHWGRTVAAAICSLGGLIFGYDLGALSGATQGFARAYDLSPAFFGFTVSVSLWGAVVASPIAGRLADRLGRRGLLAACAFVYGCAAGCLALPIAWTWGMVLLFRFLAGAAIGGFVVVCPLYLAEISPRLLRGRFVGWFQMQIGIGVVVAFGASAMVARRVAEAAEWKWCFGLGAVPAACLLLLLYWVPEEPHWLAARGRWRDADTSANRLGLSSEEWVREAASAAVVLPPARLQERLFQRKYLRPLLLATSAALFNQLCGVTILRVYLIDLLSGTGMGRQMSHNYGVLISFLNLFALLLGMMLVDKLGRKFLLIAGSAGMSVCLIALTVARQQHTGATWYPALLIAYNTFFASSQGAVTWVYLSEIFPFSVRGKGQGFGALVHWIANASLIWFFPVLQRFVPQNWFLIFAALMILQIAVVVLWYPETKGTRLGAIGEVADPAVG